MMRMIGMINQAFHYSSCSGCEPADGRHIPRLEALRGGNGPNGQLACGEQAEILRQIMSNRQMHNPLRHVQ